MANKCKCKKAEECEECPEWIFTFADLVMLMMGFFVILFVLKPPAGKQGASASEEDKHWVEVEAAIRGAFGHVPNPESNDPVDLEMLFPKMDRPNFHGPGQGGKTDNKEDAPEGHDDQVTSIRLGKYATEGGKVEFPQGVSTLSDDNKKVLTQLAGTIRGHRNMVIIKGHTSLDDLPGAATSDAKMQLSIKRAQAAATFLISLGVDPSILRVEGCSTYEPVVEQEYTADALQANRRVEIEATGTFVEEFQDRPPPTQEGIQRDAPAPSGP